MSKLKLKLTKIASGETHNQPLVQAHLKDHNAHPLGALIAQAAFRKGQPAKYLPSRYLHMLD